MAKGFKHGAGGSNPLNLKVVGNPKPDTPKENTIWVDTDVPIGKWFFSATQPELSEGDVWFPVDAANAKAFNTLKKNAIMVYPKPAQQYVGGELVDRVSEIYTDGEWYNLEGKTYIFKSGTGAIVPMRYRKYNGSCVDTDYTSSNIKVDGINFDQTRDEYGRQTAFTVDAINLDKIDTLYCEARQIQKIDTGLVFYISSRTNNLGTHSYIVAKTSIPVTSDFRIYTLDVRNYTGSYHVGVDGFGTGYVKNIWY